ncbi:MULTISPECIES: ADP-heptose--LPS heptosyltransferase RfaF [unclassified Gilliamella]|uniref:ADP-heptose--LPS heptosyltransferase RfaF n=1 Tax=unclassified Gilliamella TaxID=2685620 RepID=UPI00226A46F2|nr:MULTISPECIES: ADP-heptose--LPS heptosyltransferase RfaF [unclassified Gilliamella]MCX8600797.1 ADP-heptose--LPS heptosyltransferase RfaF [Gilliamella sp. B3722]MCX8609078.1 ADP-heptose--LPS heptosyltransferase RfaF [Gilliamella sp. B3771]MCX8610017.1 ADP-heptose--LPS heptosyltransferase RfaF [Gilliamella sp. B3891]MCX8612723.1 ADP-heptose--LPS heptosyltransferase RfaF [Gilliamella sp. B3773]MCX8616630.1 ADP-heptose--LPS heptosyltransferase RfaF [Gilliamella sp. B3770]
MKTLIIGPSWVGDMMMSQSLYRTLKQLNPNIEIDVMAPSWCRALLAKMPEVSQAIAMPLGHGEFALSKRYQLGKSLRENHYQQAIVLPNSFKSALIPYFAKIPKRTGWKGEMRYGLLNDLRKLNKQAYPLMVERYVALAYPKQEMHSAKDIPQPILWPKLHVTMPEILETLTAFDIPQDAPLIGFCPGAEFGPAKRWPDYHYATLADMIVKQHAKVLIFGSANDRQVGEQIMAKMTHSDQCINLAGKTQLDQAINLIAACKAVVTNDSGLMHVAAALDRPLVALYGPSSPDFTPPLSNKAEVIRLITGYHRVRRGDAEQGYHQSLIDIKPDQVFESLMKLIVRCEKSN